MLVLQRCINRHIDNPQITIFTIYIAAWEALQAAVLQFNVQLRKINLNDFSVVVPGQGLGATVPHQKHLALPHQRKF